METTKKLIMSFLTSDDKKVSLSVDNPREDITETEIKSAMDLVVEKNIFAPNGGNIVATVEANWYYWIWFNVVIKSYALVGIAFLKGVFLWSLIYKIL